VRSSRGNIWYTSEQGAESSTSTVQRREKIKNNPARMGESERTKSQTWVEIQRQLCGRRCRDDHDHVRTGQKGGRMLQTKVMKAQHSRRMGGKKNSEIGLFDNDSKKTPAGGHVWGNFLL